MEPDALARAMARLDTASREASLRLSTCSNCGRHIDASARICPECGGLTGEHAKARDAPASPLSFVAALVVGLVAWLVLKWLDVLP